MLTEVMFHPDLPKSRPEVFSKCLPEIWGGIECTVNRLRDGYRDQLEESGHYNRENDIEEFARLGLKAIRYPILWELHQPEADKEINWSLTSQRLDQLRKHGITVIAGLLHHGSGPSFTRLDDEQFPEKLATYARLVAKEFPWIEYYTPVNEPLTTARFSGLYGIWYPHLSTDKDFALMLLNQMKGTVLAMQEIRKINPHAKLIQTEDLGKVYSTPLLKYQAEFENHRRWLGFDLLSGKVNKEHPLWQYLHYAGISDEQLQFLIDNPCAPDLIGFNYYITSERWLDENTSIYPEHCAGGNGKHVYSDVEAIRIHMNESSGFKNLIREAWQRFEIPVAITEVHLSCFREEQLRWLKEIWDHCCELIAEGIPVKAITSWALLGSFDWNSLLTRKDGFYEPGVFDVRNNQPRPTALAKMVKAFATTGHFDHPLLDQEGWWHRQERFYNPVIDIETNLQKKRNSAPILIIGKNGTLARAFSIISDQRCIPSIALSRSDIDLRNEESIQEVIDKYKPWALINCAGYVMVDEAETQKGECYFLNAVAPLRLASYCKRAGIPFLSFSSDLVFNGDKQSPYTEADSVKPLNVYGSSKALAEVEVLKEYPSSLIIRTSAFFGPWDQYNFPFQVLKSSKSGTIIEAADDVIVSPTYVPDLVHAALDLLIDEASGIWHLSNTGNTSWASLASEVLSRGKADQSQLIVKRGEEMGWKAKRPSFSALKSERGWQLPNLDDALNRFFRDAAVA